MIPENTIRIYWKTPPDHIPFHEDVMDLGYALRKRKEYLISEREFKIVIMLSKHWITISQSRGWEQ